MIVFKNDQTDFISTRQAADNNRLVVNLIDLNRNKNQFFIISLDTEKILNKNYKDYIEVDLTKFVFPLGFIKWIKVQYVSAIAKVNSLVPALFPLVRGTRQAC